MTSALRLFARGDPPARAVSRAARPGCGAAEAASILDELRARQRGMNPALASVVDAPGVTDILINGGQAWVDRGGGLVLVDVGILSAIAIPSYFSYIERANRADAKATLMDATQFMQRFYSLHNSYRTQRDGRTQVALPAALQRSPRNGTPLYDISVQSDDNSYTLRAVPRNKADPCGTLTLNSLGVRGNDTGAVKGKQRLPAETCWR